MVERVDQAAAYRAYGISNGKVRSSLSKNDGASQDPGVYFELSDTVKAAAKEKELSVRPASLRAPSADSAQESPEKDRITPAASGTAALPDLKKIFDRASSFIKTLGSRIAAAVSSFWNGEKAADAGSGQDAGKGAPSLFAGLFGKSEGADGSPSGKGGSSADAGTGESSSGAGMSSGGSVISGEVEYLPRTSDIKAIREYMKDYGGRHLAVNSDLLTSYDRSGRIVRHDPSDADKLLRQGSDQLIDTGKRPGR